MKKQRIIKEGVSKASVRTQVHALQRDIIDFLTRHTVQDALKTELMPTRDWNNP